MAVVETDLLRRQAPPFGGVKESGIGAWTVFPISASVYSKPPGRSILARCSSPVTGFLIGSACASAISPTRSEAVLPSRSHASSIGVVTDRCRTSSSHVARAQVLRDRRDLVNTGVDTGPVSFTLENSYAQFNAFDWAPA